MMKEWYTAAELAELGLPGLPSTRRNIGERAQRSGWKSRPRKGRGGGFEYAVSALPEEAQTALVTRVLTSTAPLPAPVANPVPSPPSVASTDLTDWQRRSKDARAALLLEVDRLMLLTGRQFRGAALLIEKAAKDGSLRPDLMALIPVANARAGKDGGRLVSLRSLQRWEQDRKTEGDAALAPKAAAAAGIPSWAAPLLAAYRTPGKKTLRQVIERDLPGMLPAGVDLPSYDQAKRFLAKLDKVELARGRMGPRELKALRPYVARDTSDLWPLDVTVADGHCIDMEVQHPQHGRPFRPELTTIIDAATRLAVGWSASLSESSYATIDAVAYMVTRWGIPNIFYCDNGSGYNNALMDEAVTGLFGRLGVTKLNRLPYNSQAGGLVERSHQTIWVRGARDHATYMGAPMDPEARQKVFKLVRRDQRMGMRSPLLMPWREFLVWAQAQIDAYNARPHRGLPKTIDPETGARRHMSPNEAWQIALDAGWEPMLVTGAEADDLTRPYEQRQVRRGLVQILGQHYFHGDLEPYHGMDVLVGYDIHDAERVWVRTLEGRLICVAKLDGNKRPYMPRSAIERAAERRALGREQRLLAHLGEVREELAGARVIEHRAEVLPLAPPAAAIQRQLIEAVNAPAAANSPTPETATDRWLRWCAIDAALTAGDEVAEADRQWWERYRASAEWKGQRALQASFAPAVAG